MSVGLATTPWFTKNLAAGDVDTFVSCGSMAGGRLGRTRAMVPQEAAHGNAFEAGDPTRGSGSANCGGVQGCLRPRVSTPAFFPPLNIAIPNVTPGFRRTAR